MPTRVRSERDTGYICPASIRWIRSGFPVRTALHQLLIEFSSDPVEASRSRTRNAGWAVRCRVSSANSGATEGSAVTGSKSSAGGEREAPRKSLN
jgi:hypothetical protein